MGERGGASQTGDLPGLRPYVRPSADNASDLRTTNIPIAHNDQNLSSEDPLVGQWILGQFHILRPIGSGGMGRVYLAEQAGMDRRAAVKFLRMDRPELRPEFRRRFQQEARAVSRLSHPNIVTVYNFGELRDASLFLAMEFIEGPTLDVLLQGGTVLPERALNITRQLASALAYAHHAGVVHRDIKPENVMLGGSPNSDHPKILDFGVARLVGESRDTDPGQIVGTPQYMSPEQCSGEGTSATSDQYNLGLLFYEMLAGRPPFVSDVPIRLMGMHVNQPPPPLSTLSDDEDVRAVDSLVLRMLAKRPSDRFPTMEAVERALDEIWNAPSERRHTGTRARAGSDVRGEGGSASPEALAGDSVRPVFVLLGNHDVVSEVSSTRTSFVRVRERIGTPTDLGPLPLPMHEAGCYVLGASEQGWEATLRSWLEAGVGDERTLLCIDGEVESIMALSAFGRASHVSIGSFPLDPVCVSVFGETVLSKGCDLIDHLFPKGVEFIQVVASQAKSTYLDTLMQDLTTQRVRPTVLRRVEAVVEELVMNAIFHAPVDASGRALYSKLERSASVTLGRGDEAKLRWAVGRRFIAISVRDSFGSLGPEQLVASLASVRTRNKSSSAPGAGLGVPLVARSSRHVFFRIVPGASCEVLALVDREPREDGDRRTISVFQHVAAHERKLGDRLWVTEARGDGHDGGDQRLVLRGRIDETSDLGSVFSRSGGVRLDLSGIKSISSSGVVVWLRAHDRRSPDLRLRLENCSPAIVSQLNVLHDFVKTAEISSVLMPYYCPTCAHEFMASLRVAERHEELPPKEKCPDCGSEGQFEEFPKLYFQFLELRSDG